MMFFDLLVIDFFGWLGLFLLWRASHMLFIVAIMVIGIIFVAGVMLVVFTARPTPGINYDDTE